VSGDVRFDAAGALAVRAKLARLHEGRLVVAGDDAAVERHRAALFGVPVVGETATGRRVLVEWIGEPSPRESELVMALRARGLLFAAELAVLERASLRRKARVDGLTSRTLTADRDGMTETIRWGPAVGSYVRALAFADARRIEDDPNIGHEFRILDDAAAAAGRVVRPDAHWLRLINWLRAKAGRPPVAADHAALRVRRGDEEGLRKIDGLGRTGDWTPYGGR